MASNYSGIPSEAVTKIRMSIPFAAATTASLQGDRAADVKNAQILTRSNQNQLSFDARLISFLQSPVYESPLAYANWRWRLEDRSRSAVQWVISAKFPLPLPLPFPWMYRDFRTRHIWASTMSLKGILLPGQNIISNIRFCRRTLQSESCRTLRYLYTEQSGSHSSWQWHHLF